MSQAIRFFTRGGFAIPSSRYRAFMIAQRLDDLGRETHCYPPVDHSPAAMRTLGGLRKEIQELRNARGQFSDVRSDDIIYCQRPVNKRLRGIYLLSQSRTHPLVFDFDDAVFLERPNLTRWFLEQADIVIAGNTFLQRYAEWYADTVYKVPTAVPYDRYSAVEPEHKGEKFTIGWVGDIDAHRENVRFLGDVVESYANVCSNLRVRLVGTKGDKSIEAKFESIKNVETNFVDWIPSGKYAERIPDIISSFDAGVMPLADTFWNRGKSAFKLLEYMACGIPVVASPVGENEIVVQHGKNGYLAESKEEWKTAFEELRDKSKWGKASASARKTVESRYTLETVTHDLASILEREL